ncbi:MAG: hypothetical protein U0401_14730 [Anaerolineae bacterium]
MQYVQCRTCHGTLTEPPTTARITDPDDPALRLARLNGHYSLENGDKVIVTERGEKLGSIQQRDDSWFSLARWMVESIQCRWCRAANVSSSLTNRSRATATSAMRMKDET